MSRTQAQIDQRLNEMGIKHIVYGRMKHPLFHLPENVQPEQISG